jgi:hypothetical protein
MQNRIAFALSAALFAACTADDGSSTDDDLASAEAAATAVEHGSEPGYVSALFAVSAGFSGAASADVIADLQAHFSAGFGVPSCVTIETDASSYLEVSFDACTGPGGQIVLDGALHAGITLESGTIVYDLATEGLTVNQTTISGAWQVRDPLAAGPSTWTGDLTISGPRGTLDSSSSASFEVVGACVTYSYEAEITGPRGRTLEVDADEVTRCLDSCPLSGSVTVTGAAGGTLSWTYDGTGSVTATGGAGASFELELRCE